MKRTAGLLRNIFEKEEINNNGYVKSATLPPVLGGKDQIMATWYHVTFFLKKRKSIKDPFKVLACLLFEEARTKQWPHITTLMEKTWREEDVIKQINKQKTTTKKIAFHQRYRF